MLFNKKTFFFKFIADSATFECVRYVAIVEWMSSQRSVIDIFIDSYISIFQLNRSDAVSAPY